MARLNSFRDLLSYGTVTEEDCKLITEAILNRENLVVIGSVGAGVSTVKRVLIDEIHCYTEPFSEIRRLYIREGNLVETPGLAIDFPLHDITILGTRLMADDSSRVEYLLVGSDVDLAWNNIPTNMPLLITKVTNIIFSSVDEVMEKLIPTLPTSDRKYTILYCEIKDQGCRKVNVVQYKK